jgi:hypothetical protein
MNGEGPGHYIAAGLLADELFDGSATFLPTIGWKSCLSCGERRPDTSVYDGWCSSCAGEGQTAAEVHRLNMQATLLNAEKLLEIKRRRRDPVREIAWWEGRIAALRAALDE